MEDIIDVEKWLLSLPIVPLALAWSGADHSDGLCNGDGLGDGGGSWQIMLVVTSTNASDNGINEPVVVWTEVTTEVTTLVCTTVVAFVTVAVAVAVTVE